MRRDRVQLLSAHVFGDSVQISRPLFVCNQFERRHIFGKTLGSPSSCGGQAMLLIDDIAHTLTKSELLASIFIGYSHHLGIVMVNFSA